MVLGMRSTDKGWGGGERERETEREKERERERVSGLAKSSSVLLLSECMQASCTLVVVAAAAAAHSPFSFKASKRFVEGEFCAAGCALAGQWLCLLFVLCH
eukprot:m.163843 g.163843  ORF g.163843 m.163843 type:complete len:101 (-) comp14649_c1_seq4:153-455(-)